MFFPKCLKSLGLSWKIKQFFGSSLPEISIVSRRAMERLPSHDNYFRRGGAQPPWLGDTESSRVYRPYHGWKKKSDLNMR